MCSLWTPALPLWRHKRLTMELADHLPFLAPPHWCPRLGIDTPEKCRNIFSYPRIDQGKSEKYYVTKFIHFPRYFYFPISKFVIKSESKKCWVIPACRISTDLISGDWIEVPGKNYWRWAIKFFWYKHFESR